jgi:hypothetical protein
MYLYYGLFPSSYKDLLDDEERTHCDYCIPRTALRTYKYSSFRYLFLSSNDQALLNATGNDHASFRKLLNFVLAIL